MHGETGAPEHTYESRFEAHRWNIPDICNIGEQVCDRHAETDLLAVVHTSSEGTVHLTFGDLKRSSDSLARVLVTKGVERGQRVCLLLRNTPDAAIAALAILKIGAVVVPLSPSTAPEVLQAQVAAVEPRACVRDEAMATEASAVLAGVPAVLTDGRAWREGWSGATDVAGNSPVARATRSADPAFVVFTSGSTGAPKPVVLPHRFVMGILPAFEFLTNLGPGPGERFYASLGWNSLGGLRPVIFPAWFHGRPVVVSEDRLDAEELCATIADNGVTCAHLMPDVLKKLRHLSDTSSLAALRVVYYAGEPLGPELQKDLELRFGLAIHPYYGSTEVAMVAAGCSDLFPHRAGTVGRPVPGHSIEILDGDTLEPVPTGERGLISVSIDDPCLCLGYLNRPDLTDLAFLGDRFLTGDLGSLDEESYLWYAGRRGETEMAGRAEVASATRVEDAALGHPDVIDAVSIEVEGGTRREIVLYVVPVPGTGQSLRAALLATLQDKLPADLVPDSVELIDALPKTVGTGKVRRSELLKRHQKTRTNL